MEPRKIDKPLVLYGKGNLGKLAKEVFYELGIRPAYVFDTTAFFGGLPKDVLVAVCVATAPYAPIAKTLNDAGWEDVVPVWDIVEAYPEIGLHNGWMAGKLTTIDRNRIRSLYWEEGKSYSHYNMHLGWRCYRKEYNWVEIEHKTCLPSTLADIRARQHVQVIGDEPMDCVSIHAEGYELETIQRYMRLFRKYRPRIEVACYHSRDGLWKIPYELMKGLKNYKFTFRLHAYQGQAAYIYCVPKEKP